jgi:hypothetical protein
MKTKTELKEKKWRGTITSTKIGYIGNLKHYTINFNSGCVHVITERALGITTGDIISFDCSVHGCYFLANNITVVGKKYKKEKKTRSEMTRLRVIGY